MAHSAGNSSPNSISLQHRDRVGEGGGIWSGRPRSDRADVIADDIRKQERRNRGPRGTSESSTFQPGQMFANDIYLIDRCAASQE